MYIFSCEREYDAMLTCIYKAWESGFGHKNIKLEFEPLGQMTLTDTYIHVDADTILASKVMDAVNMKISPWFYSQLAYASMGYEDDILDLMYRMMLMGFSYGPCATEMVQYGVPMRFKEVRKRLGREINRFQEVARFHAVGNAYIAHIEPKSRLVMALGPIFEDRMPSEDWMVVDDVHKEAVVHPKNEHWYLRTFSDEEMASLIRTEKMNDEYTQLWQIFFDTIAIKERINPRCQNTLFPKWTRKHAVEFMELGKEPT